MEIKEKIRQKLGESLPGWEAQKKMAPSGVNEAYRKIRADHKKASVMLLLHEEDGKIKMLFIKRAEHPEDKHSGQISLPGGQVEPGESYREAAFREIYEEIGIAESDIELLGELSPIYVFVSNFLVHVYVAWIDTKREYKTQDDEVAAILFSDMEVFRNSDYRKMKDIEVRSRILKDVPYFDLDGSVLWGATAMMMSEFSEIIRDI